MRPPAGPSSRTIPPAFISSAEIMAGNHDMSPSVLKSAADLELGRSDQDGRIIPSSDILMVGRADRFISLMRGPSRPDTDHRVRWNMLFRVTLDQLRILIAVADTG